MFRRCSCCSTSFTARGFVHAHFLEGPLCAQIDDLHRGHRRGSGGESISADAVSHEALAPRPQTKVSLREVAEREGISLKYLEQLVRPLMNAGLLRSVRGKGGGYVLAKPAVEVRAGDILRAAEGERSTVACEGLDGTCGRSELCSTVKFWTGLEETIDAYVDGVTLAELAHVPEIKVNIEL